MKKKSIITALLSLLVLITVFSSCKNDDKVSPGAPEVKKDINLTNNAKLGKILSDEAGRTLYFFTPDVTNNPTLCVGDCAVAWPPFYKENPSLGTGLDPKDFGVITRTDGKKQSTYKGWTLFYFKDDVAAGDTKGEGLENAWFVAKPDYTIMLGHAQLVGLDGVSYTSNYKPGTDRFSPFFTDDRGVTLYTFTKDGDKKNNYTSATDQTVNAVWPIFPGSKTLVLPSILKASDFDIIMVFNNPQLTYKGKPVYTFGKDNRVMGSTKGVSVPTPGIWPVATDTNLAIQLPAAPPAK
jgi:predicted lipoprotein with Yx(FWY)xxD motif